MFAAAAQETFVTNDRFFLADNEHERKHSELIFAEMKWQVLRHTTTSLLPLPTLAEP